MFEVKSIVIHVICQVFGSISSLLTRRVFCKVTMYEYMNFFRHVHCDGFASTNVLLLNARQDNYIFNVSTSIKKF